MNLWPTVCHLILNVHSVFVKCLNLRAFSKNLPLIFELKSFDVVACAFPISISKS